MSEFETKDGLQPEATNRDAQDDLDRQADEILASLTSRIYQDETQQDATEQDATEDGAEKAASLATLPEVDALDEDGLTIPVEETVQADGADDSVFEGDAPAFVNANEEVFAPVSMEGVAAPQAEEAAPKKRRLMTLVLALVVLALAGYLAGVVAFMQVFMPNTTLNGQDVSLKTISDVAKANSESIGSFGVEVAGDGIELSIGADDIKARYDGKAYARSAIHQQHPWRWPLEIADTHTLEAQESLSYDAVRLDDIIGSAVDAANKDAKDPVDAKIVYNKESKRYEVKPEEAGTRVDRAAVLDLVRAAITAGESKVELGEDELVKPAVLKDDESLTKPVEKVNNTLEATQELTRGDEVLATIGTEDIAQWVKVADDLTVTFDDDACVKWCRGPLSEKIDTIGSRRTFKTPDGRELTISGGTYGWSINGAEVAAKISENVQAGKKAKIELTWLAQAKSWNPGGNEWGDTYVEIDLGAQHVRFFREGSMVLESDCVSGGPMIDGKDRTTPSGIYYINSNMRSGDIELRGEIDPKTNKPSYISHVKYWMPFIGDSVALHDADWRGSFGGTIYLSNGSHGCVNLPPAVAAELYGMVGEGTVVAVHG